MPDEKGTAQLDKPAGSPPPAAGETFIAKEDAPWWDEMLRKADWTAEDRQAILSKFHGYEKGYKSLKEGYAQKLQELSSYEQEVKQVAANLKAASAPNLSLAERKAESGKALDRLIAETADPTTREALRSWRDIILEETEVPALKKEVTELRQLVSSMADGARTQRAQELSRQVSELSKTYGELADSYRDRIEQLGTQYPQFSAEELLFKIAKPDELRQAVVVNSRKQPDGKPALKPKPAAPVTSSEGQPLADNYRGKNSAETAQRYKDLAKEAVRRAFEWKGTQKAA